MGRVALLVPFVFLVATLWKRPETRSSASRKKSSFRRLCGFVPWFVWGFAATAALGTLGLIPRLRFSSDWFSMNSEITGTEVLQSGGKWLLCLAMAAIGMQVGLKSMLGVGGKAVLMATLVWGIVAGTIFVTI
jgi:uncharacterized membrane protein YadS